MVRQAVVPFFLGILHRDLGAAEQHVFEMLQRYGKAGDDGGQVHSFTPVQFRTWNDDSHTYKSELRMTNEERSEERRVGKECRYRRSREHEKKKIKKKE